MLQGQMLSFLIELFDDEETQGFTLVGLLSDYLSLNSLRHVYLMSLLVNNGPWLITDFVV
jgi:hypothetical protein